MSTSLKGIVLAGLVAALAAATLAVEYAPAMLSFPLVAAAAVGWCIWLDRHPTV